MSLDNLEDNRKREQAIEEAYKLAVTNRRAGFDPVPIFNAALQKEQDEFRARRDVPIPRYRPPILRAGQWNVRYDKALARVGELTALGWTDSKIKHDVQYQWDFPNYNYHEMIDGSSNCDWQKHRAYKLSP